MRPLLVLLILFSVLLSSSSQILLKFGMTRPAVRVAMTDARPLKIVITIVKSPAVQAGLVLFGLSAGVWLFVLAKIPLSTAYPFIALGIAITVVAGWAFFAESIGPGKLIGIALVIAGITTVAFS